MFILGEDEENDNSSMGAHAFNVDGSGGVQLYGSLVYGYSLSAQRDRVLLNVSNAGPKVVIMGLDGEGRLDIPCPGGLGARISPSGNWYAYQDEDEGGEAGLYVGPSDGSEARRVPTSGPPLVWSWHPQRDELISWGARVDQYDVAEGGISSVPDEAWPLSQMTLAPDGRRLVYLARSGTDSTLKLWDVDAKRETTVRAGAGLMDGLRWSSDSSAFVVALLSPTPGGTGVLASDATGETITFVPGAERAGGFITNDTFVFFAADGSVEARKLGEATGVVLFESSADVYLGPGFAAQCERATGTMTVVNADGSNRRALPDLAECAGAIQRSGDVLAYTLTGFTGIVGVTDTTSAPFSVPVPVPTAGIYATLEGGEGFVLGAPGGRSTWTYRVGAERRLAQPSYPLYSVGRGSFAR